MTEHTRHETRTGFSGRIVILVALALLAPFYFIFPGSIWEDASTGERKTIKWAIVAGCIGYIMILFILFILFGPSAG